MADAVERPRTDLAQVRHVHLVAIAGVGMAALAGMLTQRGLRVTGSDEAIYPPMSTLLQRLGIAVFEGYRADNLVPRPDLVVIGNKVSRGNVEVEAVLDARLPYLSFPETLAEYFIAGTRSLVVAGTHGKTTTTAMLGWILEQAGYDPSLMVGGESRDFGGNFKLGAGGFFVVEGDEYDSAFFDKGPKFLHYRPSAVLLTAVEFDHADIYRDLEAVKAAFRALVALLPAGAPLVVAHDFPHAVDVAASATQAHVMSFGASSAAEWSLGALREADGRTAFSVRHGANEEGEVRLAPPGRMNALNALGAYVLARGLGLGLAHGAIASALASFSGVARRQEVVGEFSGVTLIDDFAHHPTAVAATLAAIRQRYPARRVWGIFEPRSNTSRRRVFQLEYVDALAAADQVIVAGVVQKQSDAVNAAELFSPDQLVDDLRRRGRPARRIDASPAIASLVAREAERGDVVVMMSNGDFAGLRPQLTEALAARGGSSAG